MAFLAGVPSSRLGAEIGWTTVYYYSAHDEDRRDIWRYQWRARMKIDKGQHDRCLEDQHLRNMDRERRSGDHQDEMWKRIDEEKWRQELPAQRRQRHQANADKYNNEVEIARAERLEEERAEKEKAKVAYLHLEADLRAQRRARREEELLELAKDTKEDYVYIKPRGRPEYRSRQREIDLDRISSDVSRRRSEQEERKAAREAEGEPKTSSYGRYLDLEDKRSERIKRAEANELASNNDKNKSKEGQSEEGKESAQERRAAQREKERREAQDKDKARHPLLQFDFDENGKLMKNPATREKGDAEEEALRRLNAERDSYLAAEEAEALTRKERRAARREGLGLGAKTASTTTKEEAAPRAVPKVEAEVSHEDKPSEHSDPLPTPALATETLEPSAAATSAPTPSEPVVEAVAAPSVEPPTAASQ